MSGNNVLLENMRVSIPSHMNESFTLHVNSLAYLMWMYHNVNVRYPNTWDSIFKFIFEISFTNFRKVVDCSVQ